MIIKLHLSINLTKKKMETWEIYPNSEKQTELKFEEGESQEQIEQLREEAEQLREGVYYEVAGINQGEGEDLLEDPGEEVRVQEGQLLESILERPEEESPISDYEKRKAAFETQDQQASSPKKRGRKAAAPLQ